MCSGGSVLRAVQKAVTVVAAPVTAPIVGTIAAVNPKLASQVTGGLLSVGQAQQAGKALVGGATSAGSALLVSGGNPLAAAAAGIAGATQGALNKQSIATTAQQGAVIGGATGAAFDAYAGYQAFTAPKIALPAAGSSVPTGVPTTQGLIAADFPSSPAAAQLTAQGASGSSASFLSTAWASTKAGLGKVADFIGLPYLEQKLLGPSAPTRSYVSAGGAQIPADAANLAGLTQMVGDGGGGSSVTGAPGAASGGLAALIVPGGLLLALGWYLYKKYGHKLKRA